MVKRHSLFRILGYNLSIMPYLIDGHNLIPKLGLRLDSLDDEMELVAQLQEFSRLRRAEVEVYFDGAPPGQAGTRKVGAITAHFIRLGSSADAAIEARLAKMGKRARNWIVVSSDGRVANAARAVHAGAISSEEFTLEISKARALGAVKTKTEAALSPDEVEEWLQFFDHKRG